MTIGEVLTTRRRRLIAQSMAVTAVALSACARDEEPAIRHVVLISLDTTRADHLGCYGNQTVQTPALDALAAEGTLFRHAYAAAPTTLASHTSLMTGQYPRVHGVPRNGFQIHPDNETLAEALSSAGFRCAAFLGSYALESIFGFDQGFDHFDEDFDLEFDHRRFDQSQRRASQVTDAALEYLEDWDGRDRLFLFVHYFDAHTPYDPPAPYNTMYGASVESSDQLDISEAVEAHQEAAVGQRPGFGFVLKHGLSPVLLKAAQGEPLGKDRDLAALYAGEVSYQDEHIGRLLDSLRERQILQEALVIVTADHGETFWEHGDFWNHGLWVYDTTVRVPLLVRIPGVSSARQIDQPVATVDVVPTVRELLGLSSRPMDGRSLVPLLQGQEEPPWPVFSEATQPRSARIESGQDWHNALKPKCVRRGPWKYILAPYLRMEELYHLDRDPGETQNLLENPDEEARRVREELREHLRAWEEARTPLPSVFNPTQSNEVVEQLKALGYLAGDDDDS